MNKKILTIALVVFALIFVVLLAILMGTITNKTNSANTKLVDTLDMTEGMELSNYDGSVLKGNAVITAINNGKSLGGKLKLFMMVTTNGDDGSSKPLKHTVYGYGVSDKGTNDTDLGKVGYDNDQELPATVYSSNEYKVYSAPESISPDYINESADFDSWLVKNSNDIVVGIYFKQK